MSRYDALQKHLERQMADVFTMSLTEVDALVKLPAAAKRHDFWWSNDDPRTTIHAQSRAWQLAGFDAEPNLRGKRVTFRRKPEVA
jgi:hypothetical protein